MSTPPRPPAGSFNITQALRALGIRDPTVLPQIGRELTPVISFGEFETFTPEVIEARGVILFTQPTTGGGNIVNVQMLSLAPGGTILEVIVVDPIGTPAIPPTSFVQFTIAPTRIFLGGSVVSPWSIGGQALSNLWLASAILPLPQPPPAGSTFSSSAFPNTAVTGGEFFGRIWVPASFWFCIHLISTTFDTNVGVRFREIPQAQGAQ